MNELRHHDRELVFVNNNQYSFSDFYKIFPRYSVPYGFPVRVYRKGECHYISDGANTIHLPLHDLVCDNICDRQGELERLVAFLQQEDK
jgi:hypothetical protein